MSIKGFALSFRIYIIAACVAIAASCGEGDGQPPVFDPVPPEEEAYTLVWADEFDVDGAPNVENWTMETGYGDEGWGNDEWQLYTNDTSSPDNNVRVEAGNLIITARCSAATTDPAQCSNKDTARRKGNITSARLNSKDKFEIKYGKIQARIKVPPGKGTWPAFWMLGSNFPEQPWPGAGEIDIMEIHQFFSNINTTHFVLHWCDDAAAAPDTCDVSNGQAIHEQFKKFDFALSDDYHVFEAVWDENNIVGKIDGITYFRGSIDPETQEEFLKSFFMIMNVAVGGTLGGSPSAATTWPQQMMVDWVRVYKRNRPDVLELVPEDREAQRPYIRFVNSAEFGGDSVVTKIQRTLSEDDEDFDTVTPPAVPPLTGGTVVEFDYQSANTFFSGAAFEFRLKDVTHYDRLVFSLDTSAFPDFDDINIEIQDDRFTGDGTPGKTIVPLSSLDPPTVSGNWNTYTIPLTDFSSTNLENVALLGFWNPNNAADELIAGKLYVDDMKFVREPCSVNGTVSFGSATIAGNAGSTQITVTDSCLANKSETVVVLVDNGTESIGVSVPIIASGQGIATVNFGPTEDAADTIAIQEGDVLTATYTDANGAVQADTANIFTAPLGVYSETFVDNVLEYTAIINDDTVTDEASTAVSPLEGGVSLQAAYSVVDAENGYAFRFTTAAGAALQNGSFESPDASGGLISCGGNPGTSITGWECFNFPFVFNRNFSTEPSPLPHDGTQTIGAVGNDAIVQQSISVNPGETVNASVYAMNWSGRPLTGIAIMQLNFFDASDNPISGLEVLASADGSQAITLAPKPGTAVSDWTRMELSGVAPAGTATAQIFLIHVIGGGTAASTVFFDDAMLATASGGAANDISYFNTLKFGFNPTATAGLMDLEIRMTDGSAGSASVFLSNLTPTAGAVSGWDVYEVPLSVFTGLDLSDVSTLGFYNASTDTVSGPSYPTLLNSRLYFDDVHFSLDPPAVQIGALVNSPIEGAAFSTNTQTGATNSAGEFQYLQGEIITFKVGDIVLGPVVAGPVITPVELTGSLNPTDQSAVNMLVFLQSIDANQDPSDGITISAATQAAAIGQTLDFTLGSSAFMSAVTAVVNAIAAGNSVVTETDAVNNFYQTFPPTVSASESTMDASLGTVVADGTAASTITVQAKDGSGNNITVNVGDVALSTTGSARFVSSGTNSVVATYAGNGIYTASVTNTVAEAITVSGTIAGNAITSGDVIVTFVPGTVSGAGTMIMVDTDIPAGGSSNVTVQAKDSFGNTILTNVGPVVLSVGGSATFVGSGTNSVAAVYTTNGIYTASVTNDVAETVIVSGAIDGNVIDPANNASVTFIAGAVSGMTTTISADTDIPAGGSSNVTVQAKDSFGNDILTNVGPVVLSVDGSATFVGSGTSSVNATYTMNGIYTAVVTNNVTETVTVSGTIDGNAIVPANNASVTFLVGTVSGATTTIQAQPATLDPNEVSNITVQAKDSFGNNILTNVGTVVLSVDGSATFVGSGGANSVTATYTTNGIYTASVTNNVAETVTVSGTIAGNTIDSANNASVTFLVGAVSGATTTITADTDIPAGGSSNVTVQAKDSFGNDILTNVGPVVLSVDGSATFIGSGGANSVTATYTTNGIYTASVTNDVAETVTVSGTIAGNVIDSANNASVTFVAASVSGATTTITAATDIPAGSNSNITVQAKDSFGNNILTNVGPVVLSVDGSAAFVGSGTNSVTATYTTDGIYTASVTDNVAETVTVSGTIDGNAIALANNASVTFIAASVSGATTTITADTDIPAGSNSNITVQAKDSFGNNILTNVGPAVLSVGGSATFIGSGTDSVTAAYTTNGIYTASLTNSVAETVTVSGTIDGNTIAPANHAMITFTITVSGATTTITAQPASAVNDGVAESTITVQAKDTLGNNILTNVGSVELSVDGSATFVGSGTSSVTAAYTTNGLYTASVTNNVAETVTISGTIDGNAINTANNASITFGPAVAVFSDTNANTVLDGSIEDVSGCNPTSITDITTSTYPSFEGANLKQADFAGSPNSCNGFVFNFAAVPSTGITPVSDDFQSYTTANPPGFEPWIVFSDNAGLGGYVVDPPSTVGGSNGDAISALADDGAGNQYLNFFANYGNRPVHDNPALRESISIFREFDFTSTDTADGTTWVFDFEYASNPASPITGDTQVSAFIRVFDPVFNLLDEQTFDTGPSATSVFQSGRLMVMLDPVWANGKVQIGFNNITGEDNGSGRFYDNVDFKVPPVDMSVYATLKFAIDSSLAVTPALADLEVRLEDADGGSASVFLSDYDPAPGDIVGADWDAYEIPISDFIGTLDKTIVQYLGFLDASSTESAPPAGTVNLFDATLYIDDVHFIEIP